jgi:hypothetical protein
MGVVKIDPEKRERGNTGRGKGMATAWGEYIFPGEK